MIASRLFRRFAPRPAAFRVPVPLSRAGRQRIAGSRDGPCARARTSSRCLAPCLGEDGDAVGNLPQQVKVVSDHDYGQAEQVAQLEHEFVDAAGAVRVEAGGRFVEKQQFRVECQRAGQRRPLHHAAAQFGRILCADLRLETGHGELPRRDFIDQRVCKTGVLAQRQADIIVYRKRAEQAAMLEHHPPALAQREGFFLSERLEVCAEHSNRAGVRALQQDHFAQQRRFARAAAANQREYLRAAHFEVEFGMHDTVAEARRHLADLDDRFVRMRDLHISARPAARRALRPCRPRRCETQRLFALSMPAQAGMEPRHSAPSGAANELSVG